MQPFVIPTPRRLRIVLPGGSGAVGTWLASYLQQAGHMVTVLTRGPYAAPWRTVYWDGETVDAWTETLEEADRLRHPTSRPCA
jgi:hypothetical protein